MSYYEETQIAKQIRDAYEKYKKDMLAQWQPKPGEPETKPDKPLGEYIKDDGKGWGANQNPNTWKVTRMKDDPNLFKIVDDDNVNVAHQIETEQIAKAFIKYYKSQWQEQPRPEPGPEPAPSPEPEPEPEEPTAGSSTTKDGVEVPVGIKGSWSYDVREDWRDGGARFNMKGAGTSSVMVGYFKADRDNGDEVSWKWLMGRHTGEPGDSSSYMGCGYDGGNPVGGGKARMRAECPHPVYTSTLKDTEFVGNALSCVGKWRGYMLIGQQEPNGVRMRVYQDQGDNENKPANKWVRIYEYFDDGKIKRIKEGDFEGKYFPIRNLDHTKGTAQCVWRIDDTPGLKQKWLGVAEIEAKKADGGQQPPAPAPAPAPAPSPEQPPTTGPGTGGEGWTADFTIPRTVTVSDRQDSKDKAITVTGSSAKVVIKDGVATCSGSARIHVKSKILNVVMKCEADKSTMNHILVRSRSEHLLEPARWGYSVGFEMADNEVQIKKEGLHPIYTPRIKTNKCSYKSGWNTVENRTYDVSDGVRIEGWLNGEKVIEVTDKGDWKEWANLETGEEADMKKYKYTFEMMQKPIRVVDTHYVRFDDEKAAKIRNFTITPI